MAANPFPLLSTKSSLIPLLPTRGSDKSSHLLWARKLVQPWQLLFLNLVSIIEAVPYSVAFIVSSARCSFAEHLKPWLWHLRISNLKHWKIWSTSVSNQLRLNSQIEWITRCILRSRFSVQKTLKKGIEVGWSVNLYTKPSSQQTCNKNSQIALKLNNLLTFQLI